MEEEVQEKLDYIEKKLKEKVNWDNNPNDFPSRWEVFKKNCLNSLIFFNGTSDCCASKYLDNIQVGLSKIKQEDESSKDEDPTASRKDEEFIKSFVDLTNTIAVDTTEQFIKGGEECKFFLENNGEKEYYLHVMDSVDFYEFIANEDKFIANEDKKQADKHGFIPLTSFNNIKSNAVLGSPVRRYADQRPEQGYLYFTSKSDCSNFKDSWDACTKLGLIHIIHILKHKFDSHNKRDDKRYNKRYNQMVVFKFPKTLGSKFIFPFFPFSKYNPIHITKRYGGQEGEGYWNSAVDMHKLYNGSDSEEKWDICSLPERLHFGIIPLTKNTIPNISVRFLDFVNFDETKQEMMEWFSGTSPSERVLRYLEQCGPLSLE